MLLVKTELNTIEVLISKAWIDSCINHERSVLVSNVLGEEDSEMKEEIKWNNQCKMNETVNKFFLTEDPFMVKSRLTQPRFTYSACGPFDKHRERIKKFKETDDLNYIYKNELEKACFA